MHLQNLYSQKLKKGNLKTGKGLSKKTVKMIHNVIHKALDRALKWKMVAVNVANAVDAPRLERKEMKYLTPEQVKIFLKFAKKDKFHVLFLTTVMTGLRRGEVLGLQWKDINLKLKRLAVSSSLVRRDNKYVLGEPKTRGSIRTLDLSQTVVNELKTHRKKQIEQKLRYGLEFNDDDFVFAREDGQPIHPNSLLRHFKKVLNDANLPEIRFHDLRHTHATLLLSQEINPKIVSERLGHTSVEITLDRYSHVLPNMQREAADSLEMAIFS